MKCDEQVRRESYRLYSTRSCSSDLSCIQRTSITPSYLVLATFHVCRQTRLRRYVTRDQCSDACSTFRSARAACSRPSDCSPPLCCCPAHLPRGELQQMKDFFLCRPPPAAAGGVKVLPARSAGTPPPPRLPPPAGEAPPRSTSPPGAQSQKNQLTQNNWGGILSLSPGWDAPRFGRPVLFCSTNGTGGGWALGVGVKPMASSKQSVSNRRPLGGEGTVWRAHNPR